tara:strand:+ start:93 stop:449 length:357 start_codon:yes stop_codon:yes gene_type:complete
MDFTLGIKEILDAQCELLDEKLALAPDTCSAPRCDCWVGKLLALNDAARDIAGSAKCLIPEAAEGYAAWSRTFEMRCVGIAKAQRRSPDLMAAVLFAISKETDQAVIAAANQPGAAEA